MLKPWRDLAALQRPVLDHFQRQKWYYIFGAFIWAFVWWGMMNLLKHYQQKSPFPLDVMPLIAGLPIIIVGWQAVALSGKLEHAMGDFDDGAAFVFPTGKAGTFRAFLTDFRHSMTWWSRVISLAIVVVSLVGVLRLTSLADADWIRRLLAFALILGVPLIALPIGSLFGLLMGFGQFTRIMDRHQIKFAGLSTPQARKAVRVLERVRIFAAMAPLIMCYWFAGWWIVWALGYSVEYRQMWRTQFVVLWFVSVALFFFVGLFPARNFRRRMAELSGGKEGQRARDEQIRLAKDDLEHWQQPAAERSRHQRQRIRELKLFITNLEDQRIESSFLDVRLLAALLAVNLVIFIVPIAMSVLAAPPSQVFQGN